MENINKGIDKIDKIADETILKIKETLNLFDPVIIYPYRGYGSRDKIVVKGRVLEKESVVHSSGKETDSLWKNIYKVFKRYESDEIPKVELKGTFMGKSTTVRTNDDGYFNMEFKLERPDLKNGWYKGEMEITNMPFDVEYEQYKDFEVLICNEDCDLGIISDVDDTIIKSHATDTLDKITTILTKDATSRIPFEGVKNLYDQLVGEKKRPLFFVSGSAYNLYDLLVNFCEHQKICKAPFLLRDLGTSPDKWFKEGTERYKLKYIEALFEFYPHLNFILIGDSGQKDPEIYQEVAEKYEGRVKAIYIRHVEDEKRKRELEKIKEQLKIDFLIMEDSKDALDHAKSKGWTN